MSIYPDAAARVVSFDMLGEVRQWLARFIVTASPGDLDILTLWCAHTHLAQETYTTPRLLLDSIMPGSGKTTVLEHLQRLCLHGLQAASLSSPALIARLLDAGPRTILIDEADRSLNPKNDGTGELLAILNSGYKRGATRPVLVPAKGGQWEAREMPTYAPVALAGNNPSLPDDTRSRCIRVLLMPDLAERAEESDWEALDEEAHALALALAEWAEEVREQVRVNKPTMPPGIKGRLREKWAPLRRVADACGGRWPAVADELSLADKEQIDMDREDGLVSDRPAVVLLRHLAEAWPESQPFWASQDICDYLAQRHPTVWGDDSPFGKTLTTHRLGRMLAQAAKANSTRESATGPRGYRRASLESGWSHLGMTPTGTTGISGTTGTSGTVTEPLKPVKPLVPLTPEGLETKRHTLDDDPGELGKALFAQHTGGTQ